MFRALRVSTHDALPFLALQRRGRKGSHPYTEPINLILQFTAHLSAGMLVLEDFGHLSFPDDKMRDMIFSTSN